MISLNFDPDEVPLPFGKYKGYTPKEVARRDPRYISWLYDTIDPKRCSKDLALECEDAIADVDYDLFDADDMRNL